MGTDDAVESNGEADPSVADQPSGEWWAIINTLANNSLAPEQKPQGPSSDLNVVSTIRSAIVAASEDRAWQDSGVVAHLQSALDIASQGDCNGAKAAALGLTDFVSIAQRNTPASDSGNAAATPPLGAVSTDDMPWDQGDHEAGGIHKSSSWDACTLGTEALHTRSDNSRGGGSTGRGGGGGSTGSGRSDSPTEEAAAAAVAAVDTGDDAAGRQPAPSGKPSGSGKGPPKLAGRGNGHSRSAPGRGLQRTWASEPDHGRPRKRQRAESPPLPARSLSDPGAVTLRRSNSASAIPLTPVRGGGGGSRGEAQPQQPGSDAGGGSGGGGGAGGVGAAPTIAGTAAADEGFPGHNSVVDVHPASKLLRQAKNAIDGSTENSSYWAGKVKHRLGSSTVELFFLSALLPKAVIEHMPPSLFVTDLVQRNSLAIGSEHTVIRCRLDFLTNRQLRKLRTLAELRLAAVSSLQHCAITLVPYLDAQRGLRIIGFVKVDKE